MDFDKLRTLPVTTQEEFDHIKEGILHLAKGRDETMTYEEVIELLRENIKLKLAGRDLQPTDINTIPGDFIAHVLLLGIYTKLGEIEEQLGGIGRNMWDK